MTKQQRIEKWALTVRVLEKIVAGPLTYEEHIEYGNRLAIADAKLQSAKEAMLSKRQREINRLLELQKSRGNV